MTNNIEEIQKLIEEKDRLIKEQEKKIAELKAANENLLRILRHGNKVKFGRSSEATPEDAEQLSLLNNDEELSNTLDKEEQRITIKQHARSKKKPGIRQEILRNLEREVVEFEIDSKETCPNCDSKLTHIGKEYVRTVVKYIPAKILLEQYVRNVYKCENCGEDGSTKDTSTIIKAGVPTPLLNHSIVTPSLLSQIIYLKYYMGSPLYRQENHWKSLGLQLPRATMINWVNTVSERWLTPIYDRMRLNLINSSEYLHIDETSIQVNKEKDKAPSSKSYMWVMCTGEYEKKQGVIFKYSRTRKTENVTDMINDFNGTLISDAYVAYQNIDEVSSAFCWAHVRRYFVNSIPLDSKGKEVPGSKGNEGRDYINKLFKIEDNASDLPLGKKLQKRQEGSKPLLEAFWSWVEKTKDLYTTNEDLTKALNYATNHKVNLMKFLDDPKIPISNNRCESAIRPFATHRRAWLFADTVEGAVANAILYSLVESARLNKLNIFEYMNYILSVITDLDYINYPNLLDELMPWSESLPSACTLSPETE